MYYDVCNVSCTCTYDGYFCLFQAAQTGFLFCNMLEYTAPLINEYIFTQALLRFLVWYTYARVQMDEGDIINCK